MTQVLTGHCTSTTISTRSRKLHLPCVSVDKATEQWNTFCFTAPSSQKKEPRFLNCAHKTTSPIHHHWKSSRSVKAYGTNSKCSSWKRKGWNTVVPAIVAALLKFTWTIPLFQSVFKINIHQLSFNTTSLQKHPPAIVSVAFMYNPQFTSSKKFYLP